MSKWGDLALAILAGGDTASACPSAVDRVDIVVSRSPTRLSTLRTLPTADRDAGFAERAAIIEEGAGVPRSWAEGFAKLEAMAAPRGVDAATWVAMMNAAGGFLDLWGARAAALGWTAGELFGLDESSPMRRLDRRGAAFFLIGRKVIDVTAVEIKMKDGANVLTMRRRDGFTLPAWEAKHEGAMDIRAWLLAEDSADAEH